MVKEKLVHCHITINQELLDWLEDQVRLGTFANVSHGIRRCVAQCKIFEVFGKEGEKQ